MLLWFFEIIPLILWVRKLCGIWPKIHPHILLLLHDCLPSPCLLAEAFRLTEFYVLEKLKNTMNDNEIRVKWALICALIAYTNVNHEALKINLYPSETKNITKYRTELVYWVAQDAKLYQKQRYQWYKGEGE